jgi:hypothetical protein
MILILISILKDIISSLFHNFNGFRGTFGHAIVNNFLTVEQTMDAEYGGLTDDCRFSRVLSSSEKNRNLYGHK